MSFDLDGHENLKYQRWLAESLISNLGYDSAVAASQRMAWYGVLSCLLNMKDKSVIAGPGRRTANAKAA